MPRGCVPGFSFFLLTLPSFLSLACSIGLYAIDVAPKNEIGELISSRLASNKSLILDMITLPVHQSQCEE